MRILLTILIISISGLIYGQITLENIVSNNYVIGSNFYPVDIDNNETKYVFLDTTSNTFDIYNMNFTPYLSGISLPGSFDPNYQVMYVSRKLFDCDSTNIEYVYSAPFDFSSTFKILRTDGALLFSLDSAAGLYSIGALGGSNDIRPIRNTSAGAKMYLGKWDPSMIGSNIKTYVYSLCGELPETYIDLYPSLTEAKLYPNPTSNSVTFEIFLPNNIESYDLTVYDSNGKETVTQKNIKNSKHDIDVSGLTSGTYFYQMTHESKRLAVGKFVISK